MLSNQGVKLMSTQGKSCGFYPSRLWGSIAIGSTIGALVVSVAALRIDPVYRLDELPTLLFAYGFGGIIGALIGIGYPLFKDAPGDDISTIMRTVHFWEMAARWLNPLTWPVGIFVMWWTWIIVRPYSRE